MDAYDLMIFVKITVTTEVMVGSTTVNAHILPARKKI